MKQYSELPQEVKDFVDDYQDEYQFPQEGLDKIKDFVAEFYSLMIEPIQDKLDKAIDQRNEVVAWSLYGEGEEQMKKIDKLNAELAKIGGTP